MPSNEIIYRCVESLRGFEASTGSMSELPSQMTYIRVYIANMLEVVYAFVIIFGANCVSLILKLIGSEDIPQSNCHHTNKENHFKQIGAVTPPKKINLLEYIAQLCTKESHLTLK
mmetsp:Transcript_1356/g.2641  ORF Transcript_1356/g.2641 Transcript_1356/m.2641 type:complete len:115 (-) Transcript_1356:3002-3346(-)